MIKNVGPKISLNAPLAARLARRSPLLVWGTKAKMAPRAPSLTLKVEIKRGPTPGSSKGQIAVPVTLAKKATEDERRATSSLKGAEEAGSNAGKDTAAFRQGQSAIAKLNGQVRAARQALQAQAASATGEGGRKSGKDSGAADFHAIVPINDYPQKAR